MFRLIRRILQFIITGSAALFMAACYGPPADYNYFISKITAKDNGNQPIPGLAVTINSSGTELGNFSTVLDGSADITLNGVDSSQVVTATITDEDGVENGGAFLSKEVTLTNDQNLTVIMELCDL